MNRCPWCGDKAKVKRDPLGYICECRANGHDVNGRTRVPFCQSQFMP